MRLIIGLLLLWLAIAVVGAIVEGLVWLTVVGVVLVLGTTAFATVRRRRSGPPLR